MLSECPHCRNMKDATPGVSCTHCGHKTRNAVVTAALVTATVVAAFGPMPIANSGLHHPMPIPHSIHARL